MQRHREASGPPAQACDSESRTRTPLYQQPDVRGPHAGVGSGARTPADAPGRHDDTAGNRPYWSWVNACAACREGTSSSVIFLAQSLQQCDQLQLQMLRAYRDTFRNSPALLLTCRDPISALFTLRPTQLLAFVLGIFIILSHTSILHVESLQVRSSIQEPRARQKFVGQFFRVRKDTHLARCSATADVFNASLSAAGKGPGLLGMVDFNCILDARGDRGVLWGAADQTTAGNGVWPRVYEDEKYMYAVFSTTVEADGWFAVVDRSKNGCGELASFVVGNAMSLEVLIGADGDPVNGPRAEASDRWVLAPTAFKRIDFNTKLLDSLLGPCDRAQRGNFTRLAVVVMEPDSSYLVPQVLEIVVQMTMALSLIASALFWRHARKILSLTATIVAVGGAITQWACATRPNCTPIMPHFAAYPAGTAPVSLLLFPGPLSPPALAFEASFLVSTFFCALLSSSGSFGGLGASRYIMTSAATGIIVLCSLMALLVRTWRYFAAVKAMQADRTAFDVSWADFKRHGGTGDDGWAASASASPGPVESVVVIQSGEDAGHGAGNAGNGGVDREMERVFAQRMSKVLKLIEQLHSASCVHAQDARQHLGFENPDMLRALEIEQAPLLLERRSSKFFAYLVKMTNEIGVSPRHAKGIAVLDQLYEQASAIYPLFHAKVAALASASGGVLYTQEDLPWKLHVSEVEMAQPGEQNVALAHAPDVELDSSARSGRGVDVQGHGASRFVNVNGAERRSEDRSGDSESRGRPLPAMTYVDRTKLKPVARVLQKLALIYNFDVTKLKDIVRLTIVVPSLAVMEACLESLKADPDMHVVRVKNFLNEGECRGIFTGFRAVVLNIKLRIPSANSHICELQLVHKCIMSQASVEQHARYIDVVNATRFRGTFLEEYRSHISQWYSMVFGVFRRFLRTFGRWGGMPVISDRLARGHAVVNNSVDTHSLESLLQCCKSDSQRSAIAYSKRSMMYMPVNESEQWDLYTDAKICPSVVPDEDMSGAEIQSEQVMDGSESCTVCTLSAVVASQRMIFPPNVLDSMLRECRGGGVHHANVGSLATSWMPVTNLLQKVSFQMVILAVSLFYGARLLNGNVPFSVKVKHIRMRALELRNGANVTLAGVKAIGVMRSLCRQATCSTDMQPGESHKHGGLFMHTPKLLKREGNFYFTYDNVVKADGWFFETVASGGLAGTDPIRFAFDISLHSATSALDVPEHAWALWSASQCHWATLSPKRPDIPEFGGGEACVPMPELPFVPSQLTAQSEHHATGATYYMDVSGPWFIWIHLFGGIVPFITFFLTSLFAFSQHVPAARIAIASNFYLQAVRVLFRITIYRIYDEPLSLPFPLFDSLLDLFLGYIIHRREHLVVTVVFPWSVIGMINFYMHVALTYSWRQELTMSWMTADAILAYIWAVLQLLRAFARFRAHRLVAQDALRYNHVWQRYTHENEQTLVAISALTDSYTTRESLRPTVKGVLGEVLKKWWERNDYDEPLHSSSRSLDQRYNQGFVLLHIFRHKVIEAAMHSNGSLPMLPEMLRRRLFAPRTASTEEDATTGPAEISEMYISEEEEEVMFVELHTVHNNHEMQRCIKWTTIKSVDRAVEKLQRSYNFSVARLKDVVRESICFQTLEDLLECLSFLDRDPQIKINRIKNRFAHNTNVKENGGYRSVIVNVCIEMPESVLLGIANHPCELQLTTQDYMLNRTRAAHLRYKLFRDLLGT